MTPEPNFTRDLIAGLTSDNIKEAIQRICNTDSSDKLNLLLQKPAVITLPNGQQYEVLFKEERREINQGRFATLKQTTTITELGKENPSLVIESKGTHTFDTFTGAGWYSAIQKTTLSVSNLDPFIQDLIGEFSVPD